MDDDDVLTNDFDNLLVLNSREAKRRFVNILEHELKAEKLNDPELIRELLSQTEEN